MALLLRAHCCGSRGNPAALRAGWRPWYFQYGKPNPAINLGVVPKGVSQRNNVPQSRPMTAMSGIC